MWFDLYDFLYVFGDIKYNYICLIIIQSKYLTKFLQVFVAWPPISENRGALSYMLGYDGLQGVEEGRPPLEASVEPPATALWLQSYKGVDTGLTALL